MFELIFPCHQKCFGLLSRESSHLRARCSGEATRSRVQFKIYFLWCVLFVSLIRQLLEYRQSICLYVFHHCRGDTAKLLEDCINFFWSRWFLNHSSFGFQLLPLWLWKELSFFCSLILFSAWLLFFGRSHVYFYSDLCWFAELGFFYDFAIAALQPSIDPKP